MNKKWETLFQEATNKRAEKMFEEFSFNEKPEAVITEVNGMRLPEDYLALMSEHDGGEGPLGEYNYGSFFRMEELEQINKEYDVENNWPGCVVFGSDMGDQLWAYNPERKVYCQIDSCNTGEDTYQTVSGSLFEFLIKMDEELA